MLGKLMKYEFRSGYIILPILFAISLLLGLSSHLFQPADSVSVFGSILSALSLFVATGTTFVAMIFAGIRFYKGNFSTEGYLTHTLPVSDSKILWSKLIPAYLALLVCYVVLVIALFINWQDSNDFFGTVVFSQYHSQITDLCLFFMVASLVQTLSLLAIIYCGISLAHTRVFLKNSMAYSIVFVLILYFMRAIISIVLMIALPLSLTLTKSGAAITFDSMLSFSSLFTTHNVESMTAFSFHIGLGSIIGDLILGPGFLALTHYLLKNKTSVK